MISCPLSRGRGRRSGEASSRSATVALSLRDRVGRRLDDKRALTWRTPHKVRLAKCNRSLEARAESGAGGLGRWARRRARDLPIARLHRTRFESSAAIDASRIYSVKQNLLSIKISEIRYCH